MSSHLIRKSGCVENLTSIFLALYLSAREMPKSTRPLAWRVLPRPDERWVKIQLAAAHQLGGVQ